MFWMSAIMYPAGTPYILYIFFMYVLSLSYLIHLWVYPQVVGSTQLHFGKSRLHHFQITKRYKLRFTSVYTDRINIRITRIGWDFSDII